MFFVVFEWYWFQVICIWDYRGFSLINIFFCIVVIMYFFLMIMVIFKNVYSYINIWLNRFVIIRIYCFFLFVQDVVLMVF